MNHQKDIFYLNDRLKLVKFETYNFKLKEVQFLFLLIVSSDCFLFYFIILQLINELVILRFHMHFKQI